MVVSFFVVPSSLEAASLPEELHAREALHFLNSWFQSGTGLCDPARGILKEIATALSTLPSTGTHRAVQAVGTEILKNAISCFVFPMPAAVTDCCTDLSTDCHLDAAVVPASFPKLVFRSSPALLPAVKAGEYSQSGIEDTRISLAQTFVISALEEPDRQDRVQRMFRGSTVATIIDPYLGQTTKPEHFVESIGYLLNAWDATLPVCSPRELLLITRCDRNASEEIAECKTRCFDKIVKPLQRQWKGRIRCEYKDDRRKVMHARILQTGAGLFLFERGFDFLSPSGHWSDGVVAFGRHGPFAGKVTEWKSLPEHK